MTRIIGATAGLLMLLPVAAFAQSVTINSKNAGSPTTVTADQGLEFNQSDKLLIARGNAQAVQDKTQVNADELIAHYREKPKTAAAKTATDTGSSDNGANEVYRLDAVGHVTIKSDDQTATGPAAVYDLDRKVLVMQGDPVGLTAKDGIVTAHKTLQYWSDDNIAVAEGNAVAVDTTANGAGRKIRADKLTAFFRDKPEGEKKTAAKAQKANSATRDRDLIFLRGVGNVVITTKTDVVQGDHVDYNLDTGVATVEGNVKGTHDNIQSTGGYAVVKNLKTAGATDVHVYGSAAQAKGQGTTPPTRVKALLSKKTDEAPQPMGAH